MFGGAKTVLPSFRLKKKRKLTPPPADVAHKLLRTDSIDSDPPRDLSMTMPKRNRRGRPKIKNEDCGRINNEQQNERLCNNNKVVPKTTKTHLELCPFPQISEEFSIGWVCKSENADGEVCKRTFLDKNDITAHINLHHKKSKVKKFLKVKIRKALTKEELEEKELEANEASFRCSLCFDFVPSLSSTIQEHIKVVHPVANLKNHCRAIKQKDAFMNKFRCIVCPFRTSKTATLGAHLEEHSVDEVISALVYILPDLKKLSEKHSIARATPVHSVTPLWGCKFCSFHARCEKEVLLHSERVHKISPFSYLMLSGQQTNIALR